MAIARTTETFEMGRVISRAFGALGRNIALFIGIAAILVGIPNLISGLWRVAVHDPRHQFGGPEIIALIVGSLLVMIGSAILQVAIVRATVSDLVGDTPDFASCLKAGISLILPIIGLTILFSLGIGLAVLLLIVPGVMLYVAWSVAVPAYVQERIGIVDALGRSRALTKGARWKIFGLFLVYWIAFFVLGLPIGILTAAMHASPYVGVLFTTVLSVVGTTVMRTIQATIYVELRDIKEGVSPQELETIFA